MGFNPDNFELFEILNLSFDQLIKLITLPNLIGTPLGIPVLPEVNIM